MSIKVHPGYRAYGLSRSQEDALVARQTADSDNMLRIAENSKNRLVLLNLARNENLKENPEVVEALFNRNINYLNKSLINLGYKEKSFLSKLF